MGVSEHEKHEMEPLLWLCSPSHWLTGWAPVAPAEKWGCITSQTATTHNTSKPLSSPSLQPDS